MRTGGPEQDNSQFLFFPNWIFLKSEKVVYLDQCVSHKKRRKGIFKRQERIHFSFRSKEGASKGDENSFFPY